MAQLPAKKPFSIQRRLRSFYYAYKGIRYVLLTQHNAWIHLFISISVVVLGLYLDLNRDEWCWIMLAMGIVLVSEAFNTALEVLTDLVSPDFHPLAEITKDVASGAVLLAALCSVGIGLLVFLPHLIQLFTNS